jgi:hypothetical protein
MEQQILNSLRQSIYRIVLVLVHFLPGVIALLLALVLFTLVGLALSSLVRRILSVLRFDERMAARETPQADSPLGLWSPTAWSPSNSPTLLAARIVLWGFVLLGITVGISAFDASYSADSQYAHFLLPYVAHMTGAVLILLAGSLLARFLARSVLIGAVNAQLQYARLLSLGIKWLVLTFTAAMVLEHLQIGGGVVELAFGILFGGIVLTLSLSIGLGSRDLVSRSIERTMERNDRNATPRPTAIPEAADPTRSKLRHF